MAKFTVPPRPIPSTSIARVRERDRHTPIKRERKRQQQLVEVALEVSHAPLRRSLRCLLRRHSSARVGKGTRLSEFEIRTWTRAETCQYYKKKLYVRKRDSCGPFSHLNRNSCVDKSKDNNNIGIVQRLSVCVFSYVAPVNFRRKVVFSESDCSVTF